MSSRTPTGGSSERTDKNSSGNQEMTSSPSIALKILVSNGIAGSIIGRAGSTISELQSLSGSRIKLSQNGECFPGTNERVCLIQGEIERMKAGIHLILQRFILANDSDDENDTGTEDGDEGDGMDEPESKSTTFQLKVLIPSSACGMLIGRNGRHIKSIASNSQTKIQLGQKEEISSITTGERIFSIQGGKENVLHCVDLLIECIEKEIDEVGGVEENSVWRYVNMTTGYSKAVSGIGRNTSFGGRVILPREVQDRSLIHQHQGSGLLNAAVAPGQVRGGQIHTSNQQGYIGTRDSTSVINSVTSAPTSVQPSRSSGGIDFTSLPTSPASAASIAHAASQVQLSSTVQLFKVEESPQASENNSSSDALHTVTLAIPDPLIGSIIGHNGSTLTQLQLCSQTRIQISQRGEHVPGTNQRLVRITGNTKENCDAAQFWIGQRMTMAQSNMDGTGRGSSGQRRRYQGKGGNRGGRASNDMESQNDRENDPN